jgi:ankyrin repeat protein
VLPFDAVPVRSKEKRSRRTTNKGEAAPQPRKTAAERRAEIGQLFWASSAGNVRRVKALLKEGAEVNGRSGGQKTPLYAAAESGRVNVGRVLIEAGADVDAADYLSFTPLHMAAAVGDAKMVELLLDHGANASARNTYRETPLHAIAGSGNLLPNLRARVRVVALLLDAGADIEARGNSVSTPLNVAVMFGNTALVRVLLARGANPNPKVSALEAARENGDEEIEALLRKAGVKR